MRSQITSDRRQVQALGDLLADGTLDPVEYRRLRDRVASRISESEAELRRNRPNGIAVVDADLRAAWKDLSVDEQRRVLSALVDRIDVAHGRSDLLSVRWVFD